MQRLATPLVSTAQRLQIMLIDSNHIEHFDLLCWQKFCCWFVPSTVHQLWMSSFAIQTNRHKVSNLKWSYVTRPHHFWGSTYWLLLVNGTKFGKLNFTYSKNTEDAPKTKTTLGQMLSNVGKQSGWLANITDVICQQNMLTKSGKNSVVGTATCTSVFIIQYIMPSMH